MLKSVKIFATTWVCKSTLSKVHSIKSKYKSSISSENLASELKCAIRTKHTLDF